MAAVLALFSSLMWGTADFLGGAASRRWPSLQVVAVSQGAGLLALLVAVAMTGEWRSDPAYWWWAIPAGVASVICLGAFYRALAIGPMGIVSPIASLGVAIPLGVALAQGESPSSWQMVGISAALIGVVLASGPELRSARWQSLSLTLVAAAGFGAVIVFLAQGSRTSPLMTVTGMRLVSVLILVVVVLASRRTGPVDVRGVTLLAAIGLLDAGANLLLGMATTAGLLSTTSVLGNLYPAVTAVLAAWLLRERLLRIQYVGVVAVLVGVVLIAAG